MAAWGRLCVQGLNFVNYGWHANWHAKLQRRTLLCPGTGTAIVQPLWLPLVVLGLWQCIESRLMWFAALLDGCQGTRGVAGTAASLILSLVDRWAWK